MAQKKYSFIRVYDSTKKTLDDRTKKINEDLKGMGIRRTIPKIRFLDEIAKKLTYISNQDLIKMSYKRRNKLC